mgnify:CR=1 FL=1
MRVECEVEAVILTGDNGKPMDGVCVTCSRCDHEAEAFGTTALSVRRAAVKLRETCPEGEKNFYAVDEEED